MDSERDQSMAVDTANEQSNPLENGDATSVTRLQVMEPQHSESDSDKNLSQYALVQDEDIRSPQINSALEAGMIHSGGSNSQSQIMGNQSAGKALGNSDSTALSKLLFGSAQKQASPGAGGLEPNQKQPQAPFMQNSALTFNDRTVTENGDDSSEVSFISSQVQMYRKVQKTQADQQILSNIENIDPEQVLNQMGRQRKIRSKKGKMNNINETIASLSNHYNNPQMQRMMREDPELYDRIKQNIEQLKEDFFKQQKIVDNQDDTFSVTTDGHLLVDPRQQSLCNAFNKKTRILRTPSKRSSEQSLKNPSSSGISMIDSIESYASEKRSTRSVLEQNVYKLEEPRFNYSSMKQFPQSKEPAGFAVQTEAIFASNYDMNAFNSLKNPEGSVHMTLGYPLNAEAWFYPEGRVVIKIQVIFETINHYNIQQIAKKFMEDALEKQLLTLETEFEIPSEYWLLSDDCALGFKLLSNKLDELSPDDGFKTDNRGKNYIEWQCKMRKVNYKIFENGNIFIHSFCNDYDLKRVKSKFHDIKTGYTTLLNKLKPYDADRHFFQMSQMSARRQEKSVANSVNTAKQSETKSKRQSKSCNFEGMRQKHVFQFQEVHHQPKQFPCFKCGDVMNLQIPHHNMVVIFKDQEKKDKDSQDIESSKSPTK